METAHFICEYAHSISSIKINPCPVITKKGLQRDITISLKALYILKPMKPHPLETTPQLKFM